MSSSPNLTNKLSKKQDRIKVIKKYYNFLIIKKYRHLDFTMLDKKIHYYKKKIKKLLENNIVSSKDFLPLYTKLQVFICVYNAKCWMLKETFY